MPNFRVQPFEPAHYVQAVPRGSTVYAYAIDPDAEAEARARGHAFSAFVDDALAGCAGIHVAPWGGSARLWAVLTDVGRQHPVFMHREVCRRLVGLTESLKLVRLDAEALVTFPAGCAWLEAIGRYLIKRGWKSDYEESVTGRPRPVVAFKAGPSGVDFYRWGWFRA